MASVIKSLVRSVMEEMGKEELIPVNNLRNSANFKPYNLLSRKRSSSWFWKPCYSYINLSIMDILEPNAPEPELEIGRSFHISCDVDRSVQGGLALSGKLSGGYAVYRSSHASVDMFILQVYKNTWEILQRERDLKQPEHKILQQLRGRGDDLFVVTEVLQTQEEVQITRTRTHRWEGSGHFPLPGVTSVQGEGKGHISQKKTVTIPAHSTLAFKVVQLLIDPKWDILLIPHEKQRTFGLSPSGYRKAETPMCQPMQMGYRPKSCYEQLKVMSEESCSAALCLEDVIFEESVMRNFQGLCAEVKAGSTELAHLESKLRRQLLVDIGRILQDQPQMEALEASLQQGLFMDGPVEPLDGPAGRILECLVWLPGELWRERAVPMFYLLGALRVLSDTQQQLLAETLETTVLSKQLELVEHILEQTTPWKEQSSVSLPARLLGDSWDEGAPTWVILEECGLRLQVNNPQVHWEPNSQGPTCALYASLVLLISLSR